jgi:NADH pyrophosphatase NudC (nudix superfamily)
MKPIDAYKFCPLCAGELKVSRSNLLICQKCGYNYYINAKIGVNALILDSQNNILLETRNKNPHKGKLQLPGGFQSIGESLEQTIIRELTEELSYSPIDIKYFGSSDFDYEFEGINHPVIGMCVLIKISDTDKANLVAEPEEVETFAFYDIKTLDLDKIGFESDRSFIKQYFNIK